MCNQLTVQQTAQLLLERDRILILSHQSPDGDTIGSGYALCRALHQLGKRAAVLCADAIPWRMTFVASGMKEALWLTPEQAEYVVAVDIADVKLMGSALSQYQQPGAVDLCIDHHPSNTRYARDLLLCPKEAAACQILYDVITAMGVSIDQKIAQCLYLGIATDTGCFRYSNTQSRSHEIVSKLMETGFDWYSINYRMFELKTKAREKTHMKKRIVVLTMAVLFGLSAVACGSEGGSSSGGTDTSTESSSSGSSDSGTVANKDKPLVWFNRQPSNSSTGELDMAALSFNEDTYYVGFDANQGAELQGTMVKDYIEANIDTIDRNGDGVIGYVLAIGDIGHNDSIARTRGVRKALGTGVEKDGSIDSEPIGTNTDGSASAVQDGSIEVNGKTYTVRELASQEMKNSAGATWDAATAGNAIGTWSSSFGDQIDVVVSNNDGMGMSMFNAWSKDNDVPTFGYDANNDAVAAIAEGYGGTISQHADVQAYLTLRVLRNALDGVDVDTGIGTADEAGNVLSDDVYVYNEEERSYYALNVAVTAENYQDFTDSTKVYEPVSNQLDESSHPTKKVWLDIYNASDNFLSSTYQPLLQNYDDLMNLDIDYIGGDGQTESNITNRLGNPGQYDAFAINMVKTDNAASYTALLSQ